MTKTKAILTLALALILAGCTTTQPQQTVHLKFAFTVPNSWGVDIARYDFRFAADSASLANSWETCSIITLAKSPKQSGAIDTVAYDGTLASAKTYYFALKTVTVCNGVSPVGNLVGVWVCDSIPPAKVSDLSKL